MLEISRFYGISIKMYFSQVENNPPHVHAIYGKYTGEFDLTSMQLTRGFLPIKAQDLVLEWAKEHEDELMNMWDSQIFKKIKPLE